MRFIKGKKEKGFTLIELLVGMVIIVISATAVVILISSSFRISNKTTNIGVVRENGNNALNFIQRTIQFGYAFSGVSNDPTFASYSSDCTTPDYYSYIRIKNSTGVIQQFSCTDDGHLYYNDGTGDSDMVDLTKVNVTSCQFYCSQSGISSPPVIEINFSLALKTSSSLPEQVASVDFTTSAKMRNP